MSTQVQVGLALLIIAVGLLILSVLKPVITPEQFYGAFTTGVGVGCLCMIIEQKMKL